jgi:hypothetical protein
MAFTQLIELYGIDDEQQLQDHIAGWHQDQSGTAPGYLGSRVFSDADLPTRYVIEVDFSSEEEAKRNDVREETETWAQQLREMAKNPPGHRNLRQTYSTYDG